jgi:hypothetical protein
MRSSSRALEEDLLNLVREGCRVLRNVGIQLPRDEISHSRRMGPSATSPRKLQSLRNKTACKKTYCIQNCMQTQHHVHKLR